MRVKLFIYFYFYFIIHYTYGNEFNQVIDLSNDCDNYLNINYFLTYGMGIVDSTVIKINSGHKNCTITFHSDTLRTGQEEIQISQIIVLETINSKNDLSAKPTNSKIETNDYNNITILPDPQLNFTKLYNDLNADNLFVGVYHANATTLVLNGSSPVLKITATAARVPMLAPCQENEIKCSTNNITFCFNSELLCDGNINCGNRIYFDEAAALCEPEFQMKHIWFIITCFILFIFLIAVLARCVANVIPKVSKTNLNHLKRNPTLSNGQSKKSIQVLNKPIRITQIKSPQVVVNYCRRSEQIQQFHSNKELKAGVNLNYDMKSELDFEEDIHSHLYSAGKLYQANQKRIKRLTTNSPVIRRPRKNQYVRETFGREILFLVDEEGKRHRLKRDEYFST